MAPLLKIAPVKIPQILKLCAGVERIPNNDNKDIRLTVLKNTAIEVLFGISEIVESQQQKSAGVEFSKAGERFDEQVRAEAMKGRVVGRILAIEAKLTEAKRDVERLDEEAAEGKLREVSGIAGRDLKRKRDE